MSIATVYQVENTSSRKITEVKQHGIGDHSSVDVEAADTNTVKSLERRNGASRTVHAHGAKKT